MNAKPRCRRCLQLILGLRIRSPHGQKRKSTHHPESLLHFSSQSAVERSRTIAITVASAICAATAGDGGVTIAPVEPVAPETRSVPAAEAAARHCAPPRGVRAPVTVSATAIRATTPVAVLRVAAAHVRPPAQLEPPNAPQPPSAPAPLQQPGRSPSAYPLAEQNSRPSSRGSPRPSACPLPPPAAVSVPPAIGLDVQVPAVVGVAVQRAVVPDPSHSVDSAAHLSSLHEPSLV